MHPVHVRMRVREAVLQYTPVDMSLSFPGTLTAVVLSIFCVFSTGCTAELTWKHTDNDAALCNDFTRAGFFHRNARGEQQK